MYIYRFFSNELIYLVHATCESIKMDIKKLVVLISIFDHAIGIELFTKLKDYLAIFTSYQPNEWYTPEWIDYNHTGKVHIVTSMYSIL